MIRLATPLFIPDNAQIASILNSIKKRSILYPNSCHFVCERIFNIDVVYAEKIEAEILCVFIKYKESFTAMISFAFCS